MSRWCKLLGIAAVACALVAAKPGPALASSGEEMVLQDDVELIYVSPAKVATTLEELRYLGVDRVRVSVVWGLLAPKPLSSHRPRFDATNPAAYPAHVWDRYDVLVRMAQELGIKIYFEPTAPAPYWATPPLVIQQGYRWSHDPSAREFGEFVQAVGRRYSGGYLARTPANMPTPAQLGIPGGATSNPAGPTPIPRVSEWGIWNEPNIGGWMTPQWRTIQGGQKVEASPAIYRGMLDAAWTALRRSGHGGDTILIGETAAYGANHKGYGASMDPLTFLRALYCVGTSYRPLSGARASELSCPTRGGRRAFVAAHPALFEAPGYAHHPYDFDHPPAVHLRNPNAADLSDLGRIERALDAAFRAYGQRPGIPLYLTEWGYQTNPPNPFIRFTLAQQAAFLNQGEYMAWRDPRVRAFGQFLFVDDSPNRMARRGSRSYWSTFDSGLLFLNGKLKPAYWAFKLPLWLPDPRHGPSVALWADLRSADHAAVQYGQLQFRPAGSQAWQALGQLSTTNSEGFLYTHVALPSPGSVRIGWLDPFGVVEYSRIVAVS